MRVMYVCLISSEVPLEAVTASYHWLRKILLGAFDSTQYEILLSRLTYPLSTKFEFPHANSIAIACQHMGHVLHSYGPYCGSWLCQIPREHEQSDRKH